MLQWGLQIKKTGVCDMAQVSLKMNSERKENEVCFGVPFSRVFQNNNVLKCAQNYLELCSDLDKKASEYSVGFSKNTDLPTDLRSVENGVSVLCAAYAQASGNKNSEVCKDVADELTSLSSFYQEKVAEAYFSASNILLDAHDVADKADVLDSLRQSRRSLQQVHAAWPTTKDDKSLTSFFEKVDYYGRQLGIDGRVYPKKKSEKMHVFSQISPQIAINARCA